ncbi:hypothetical protein WR25_25907 [Diploscapter pachys]|uniref:Major facilitator superfamily (MFS) profile domain-containing protein n=1 Tax=Diploscapter pachys TaxID=2018661 RepID=A0A2A2J1V7_9BILA|nr:hypothetical protein WR25_25907 [Diploscapter pachys]
MPTSLSDDSSGSPFAIQPAVRDPYLFLFFRWKIIQHRFVYPPAVFFMLGNELCERFSFYGMRAILTLYLKFEHHFSNSTATLIYHLFSCIAYFTPLIGSLLADCWLGRFKVILFGSIIYVFGHALLSGGAVPFLSTGVRSTFDFSGLLVIALATGAIKPCVSAFAADQFREDQADLRAQFFSFFYFAINTGSLFAIFLTPILRGRVHCMGSKYCFPLAFGVPGVLMLIALLIFLAAVKLYKKPPPSKDNIGRQVASCVYTGASRSICGKNKKPVDHWLDRAAPEHSSQLIEECKRFLAVVLIFSPLPFFWALYDQQGSTWILQAQRLNGRLGFFTMLPDQVNALNPLLILIFVPIFEGLIYPAARKVVKVTPLRKISIGLLLAALSFAMAGILQLEVNKTMEPSPAEGRVFIQKVGNAPVSGFSSDTFGQINGGALSSEKTELDAGMYSADVNGNKVPINLTDPNAGYVVGFFENSNGSGDVKQFKYRNEKTENGATRIHVLVPEEDGGRIFACNNDGELDDHNSDAVADLKTGNYIDILPGLFCLNDFSIKFYKFRDVQ